MDLPLTSFNMFTWLQKHFNCQCGTNSMYGTTPVLRPSFEHVGLCATCDHTGGLTVIGNLGSCAHVTYTAKTHYIACLIAFRNPVGSWKFCMHASIQGIPTEPHDCCSTHKKHSTKILYMVCAAVGTQFKIHRKKLN